MTVLRQSGNNSLWTLATRMLPLICMGSAVLFIYRSRLLVYSAGSGVNRVQVVLSELNVRLSFVQAKLYVGMVVCIS